MNTSLAKIEEPSVVSYVVLNYDGRMEVKISAKDYQEYNPKFSFDRLCGSMSDVFRRFLEYYRQGLENRIVTELKGAR